MYNEKFVKRKVRKSIAITLTLLLAIASAPLGAIDAAATVPDQNNKQDAPTFSNVSVHDPSTVKDGDTYYVFGSHISAAKSKDLTNWTSFANDYNTPGNTLYGDLSKNLAGSLAWAGENNADSKGGFSVWAPDVFWNEHYVNEDGTKGAYMIYYSASSTYIRSAIGIAVAPKIEGPYQYVDTIIHTGFTKETAFDKDSKVDKKWTNTPIQQLIKEGKLEGPRSGSSSWYTGSTGLKIKTNEWTHLAFTVDRGVLAVYVNGKLQFTGSGFPDVFTSKSGTFSLGVNWWDPAFKGSIDELSIFEGALPPPQVAELAKMKVN